MLLLAPYGRSAAKIDRRERGNVAELRLIINPAEVSDKEQTFTLRKG